jgi:hypothetical protein
MISAHSTTTDEGLYATAEHALTSEGVHPSSVQPELERQMAEFGIGYDGRQYEYDGYRYGRLADAIAYARLMRSRPKQEEGEGGGGTSMQRKAFAAPTDADRTLMASLDIDFEDGAYRFEGYCYDDLSDAVNYARLMLQRRAQ